MSSTIDRRLHRHRTTFANRNRNVVSRRTPRILFVDDDPDIQTTFELRMRPYAVEIDHAYFGTQGIVEAIKRTPDLILMDLAMPNGNGEYLLETIRRNPDTSEIPVIVFTGMRDPTVKNRVMRMGAGGFVQKPALFDDLIHEIGRFVDIQPRRPRGGC